MVDVPKPQDKVKEPGNTPPGLNSVDVLQGQQPKTDAPKEPTEGTLDLSGIKRDKQGRIAQVENQSNHDPLWSVKYVDDKGANVQSVELQDTPSNWISIDKQKDGSYVISWAPPNDKKLAPLQVYDVKVDQKTGAISFDAHHKGSVDHINWKTNGEIQVNGKVPTLEKPVVWYETAAKK